MRPLIAESTARKAPLHPNMETPDILEDSILMRFIVQAKWTMVLDGT
jgi:hypothetical protein